MGHGCKGCEGGGGGLASIAIATGLHEEYIEQRRVFGRLWLTAQHLPPLVLFMSRPSLSALVQHNLPHTGRILLHDDEQNTGGQAAKETL